MRATSVLRGPTLVENDPRVAHRTTPPPLPRTITDGWTEHQQVISYDLGLDSCVFGAGYGRKYSPHTAFFAPLTFPTTIQHAPIKKYHLCLCFTTQGTDRLPGWIKMTVSVCEF